MIKRTNQIAAGCALALGITAPLSAQDKLAPALKPTPPPAPSVGLVNEWLRDRSRSFAAWDIGGQFRARYEVKENGGSDGASASQDFMNQPPAGSFNDNQFLFLREKIHVGYTPFDWLNAYVEARDASSTGDSRNPNPGADQIDLHQAYAVVGDLKKFPVTLKVGRQELIYGDERLVGAGDWGNLLRSFDAAKLRFENKDLWVDVFGGRPVLPDNHNFNVVNDYEFLSGIYASTKTYIPKQETQLYFLSRNASAKAPFAQIGSLSALPSPRDVYTAGLRVKSLPGQFNGWDYGAELARQFGSINVGGIRLDHDAFAGSVMGGYTFAKTFGAPRVGLEYSYASGDSNPADSTNETFDNLFPTNHKHYGYMDIVGWRNLHDARLAFSMKPAKALVLGLDFHAFWLADDHDFFYPEAGGGRGLNGYGRNAQYGSSLGSELDLDATWTIKPWAIFRAGYGHFFHGTYIKKSLAASGGAQDADWVYAQVTFNF